MAIITVKQSDPPPFFKRLTGGSDYTLHLDTAHGGSAPLGINHLPSAIFVEAKGGEVLSIEDAAGNVATTTFGASATAGETVFAGWIPCSPTRQLAATTAGVTVFWRK